ELNEAELSALLQPRLRTDGSGKPLRFVPLKRKVTVETWRQIQQTIDQLFPVPKDKKLTRGERDVFADLRRAIFVESVDSQLRVYPHRSLAAHVLGFVGADDRGAEGRWVVCPGREGIELTLNTGLSGARGWRVTEVDGKNREVVAFREQDVAPRA